jgi:PhnB protein
VLACFRLARGGSNRAAPAGFAAGTAGETRVSIEPYLFFNGCCEEAIEFYKIAAGARVETMMRYRESPDPVPEGRLPAGWDGKILHATLRIGGARLMVSDGDSEGTGFRGFGLSLALPGEAEARRAFAALSEGGQTVMPIGGTFWSPCFGMATDRFGVLWMVTVVEAGEPA